MGEAHRTLRAASPSRSANCAALGEPAAASSGLAEVTRGPDLWAAPARSSGSRCAGMSGRNSSGPASASTHGSRTAIPALPDLRQSRARRRPAGARRSARRPLARSALRAHAATAPPDRRGADRPLRGASAPRARALAAAHAAPSAGDSLRLALEGIVGVDRAPRRARRLARRYSGRKIPALVLPHVDALVGARLDGASTPAPRTTCPKVIAEIANPGTARVRAAGFRRPPRARRRGSARVRRSRPQQRRGQSRERDRRGPEVGRRAPQGAARGPRRPASRRPRHLGLRPRGP